jgi:hypothetical protein
VTEIQQVFDYRELTEESRSFVKERALLIHDAAKKTAQGIILIGQWLSEVKERLGHGGWMRWLNAEFGWSWDTADRFIRVYENLKIRNLRNLEIDISALYLITAPKTPEPVRQEVIERAQSGEPMTRAKAVEVLEQYRQRAEVPTPGVARQIAIGTGVPTLATNNTYVLPMSKEAEADIGREQELIRGLYSAAGEIANAGISPADMAVLGEKHFCRDLGIRAAEAGRWLLAVAEEVSKR